MLELFVVGVIGILFLIPILKKLFNKSQSNDNSYYDNSSYNSFASTDNSCENNQNADNDCDSGECDCDSGDCDCDSDSGD